MRPVTRNTNPSYQFPETFLIVGAEAKGYVLKQGLKPIKKTKATFDALQVVALIVPLVTKNGGAKKWKLLTPDELAFMNYMIENVFSDSVSSYKTARLSLVTNYGQYCSYCGMPVYDSSLAVEHLLPKSVFPDVAICYPNFLLACPYCNSIKGDDPSYEDAKKCAVKKPTYDQLKEGGYLYAVWPDNRMSSGKPPKDINKNAYDAFVFYLQKYKLSTDAWSEIDTADYMNLSNKWQGVEHNLVEAIVAGTSQMVGIFWAANTNDIEIESRVDKMIYMMQLNKIVVDDSQITDRRMLNRTIAFFELLATFNRLITIYKKDSTKEKFFYTQFKQQVYTTARYSGFYEIWIEALYYFCQKNIIQNSFYTDFKTATCNASNPYAYFPGTDPLRLP